MKEKIFEFMLKQKDNEVAQIGIYKEDIKNIIEIDKIIDKNKLPYGFKDIQSFNQSRKPPRNREFAESLLASVPDTLFPGEFLKITLGLSLNDTYWFSNSDFPDLEWKKYNLYNNPFSEALSRVAFTGYSNRVEGLTTSPEFTTTGMLRKCWGIKDGRIILYKGGTSGASNAGFEPYSEYYSCQILEKLDIPYINYNLEKFHGELVSTCECFCNENLSYTPIFTLMSNEELINSDVYTALDDRMKHFGEREFKDMFLFDYLTFNYDRHLGNFGMYYNPDTKEIIGPAKIYDNGAGLLAYGDIKDFENRTLDKNWLNGRDYIAGISFDNALQYLIDKDVQEKAKKLINFKFTKHEKYNLSDNRLKVLENFIQNRVFKVINYDLYNHEFKDKIEGDLKWN